MAARSPNRRLSNNLPCGSNIVFDPPSIELLESTHNFPVAFTIKVIGYSDDRFVARVVAAVRTVLDESIELPYRTRETSGGRHVAITLEPIIQSAHQVLAVYERIYETSGLILVL
jgi:putative lipoic acid-binding regulatory protein